MSPILTPRRAGEIFVAYSAAISLARDWLTLSEYRHQIRYDDRLTFNQREALTSFATTRELILARSVQTGEVSA